MKFSALSVTFCLILPAVVALNAIAAPTDINANGISDFLLISINQSSSLKWQYLTSKSKTLRDIGVFGKNGNHLVPAHWLGTKKTDLAILEKGVDGAVTWRLKSGDKTVKFGEEEDILVAGGDFDGTGASDAAIVLKRDGAFVWKIWVDPFVSQNSPKAEITFGTATDLPFYFSPEGGKDWLAVFRKGSSSTLVILKNPLTGEERTITLPSALASYATPLPVALSGGKDTLVFTKVTGGKTMVRTYSSSGRLLKKLSLPAARTAVVGNFIKTSPGEEVAVQGRSSFAILAGRKAALRAVGGLLGSLIPVDEININTFSSVPGPQPTPIEPVTCGDWDSTDGTGGFVWKPLSDTVGKAVAVMPGRLYGKVSKVEIFDKSGNYIKEIKQFSGCGNPDQYGLRCNFKDFQLSGADYRRIYGSITVKATLNNGGCAKFFIADPSRRVD